jgi:hypothetical protein
MTEQEFTTELLKWAKVYGWRRFHARTSGRMSNGRPIPTVQGESGFPDLVLVRNQRLVFAELKVGKNKPSDQQLAWMGDLGAVDGTSMDIEVYVWRPEQWSEILVVLAR